MMKKKEIIELLAKKEDKYFDLVWYARKTEEQYNTIPEVKENVDRIHEMYQADILDLGSDDGQWVHGFNSGMLAGMRYALTLMDNGVMGGQEYADEYFPFLDT
jgi:hypothetical protein